MLHTPPHLKVAFTTNSLTWIDADFASGRHLVFYDVSPATAEFLDVLEFRAPPSREEGPGHGCPGPAETTAPGDLLAVKLAGLRGSGVLFTRGLSDRTAMRVADGDTYPVVVEYRRAIDDVIARLQRLMYRDPPLWLCRVLRYGALPPSPPPPEPPAHDRL